MDLMVGVAYGSELQLVQSLLQEMMDSDDRISKYPQPAVLFHQLASSSIDVKILFWVQQLKDGFPTKSDLISAIDTRFRENGIVIPFPQQVLQVQQEPEILESPANEKPPEKET